MAGRQGFLRAVSRNPNEDALSWRNSHNVSDLAFSDSVVGFPMFDPFSGFASAMTLEMSLALGNLPTSLVREYS